MELKWTSKALSDLARLYDFLVLASKPAAARTVQLRIFMKGDHSITSIEIG